MAGQNAHLTHVGLKELWSEIVHHALFDCFRDWDEGNLALCGLIDRVGDTFVLRGDDLAPLPQYTLKPLYSGGL